MRESEKILEEVDEAISDARKQWLYGHISEHHKNIQIQRSVKWAIRDMYLLIYDLESEYLSAPIVEFGIPGNETVTIETVAAFLTTQEQYFHNDKIDLDQPNRTLTVTADQYTTVPERASMKVLNALRQLLDEAVSNGEFDAGR